MAIGFDATAAGTVNGTTFNFSHTCTGSNLVLFVGVFKNGSTTDDITSVTYNGVTMTQINTRVNVSTRAYLYVLANPSTGANNVTVTGVNHTWQAISQSYTGAAQSGQPDSSNTNQATNVANITTSTTVVASSCWIVSFCSVELVAIASAGTGTTRRNTQAANSAMGDSNATVGTGSQSMQWTSGAGENMVVCIASLAPAGATSAVPLLPLLGAGI